MIPGFNRGAYAEKWAVYLDLNQDKQLTANELVDSGNSSGKTTLESDLAVPAFAKMEAMLLRVAMRYGANPPACGKFTWGEVEDYRLEREIKKPWPLGVSAGSSHSCVIHSDGKVKCRGNNGSGRSQLQICNN